MKNRSLFIILAILTILFSSQYQPKHITPHNFVSAGNVVPSHASAAVLDAKQIIQEIIDVIGLKMDFQIQAANVPNAAAVSFKGKRFVLYNPAFINALNKATGNKWASVSVLAHEIGHHFNGHTLDGTGSRPDTELEADEFSGFVLRKMGASLYDAQIAMKLAADRRGTKTHPGQQERLVAIARGWYNANSQLNEGTDLAKRNATGMPNQKLSGDKSFNKNESQQAVLSEKYIIGNVHFNTDANSKYYVTTKYNLVKVNNNQLYLVGKVAALNSSRFPYLIYDKSNTQLFVDAQGNIFTKTGKHVGYLQAYTP